MSILDSGLMVGLETTYGTAATLTRSFEAQADSWKREQQRLESVGMRNGMQAVRSDRVAVINMGGAGAIELDVLNKGMGLLWQGCLGAKTGPTQQAATAAYLQTFTAAADAPTESFTIQMLRPYASTDAAQQFTHKGCVFTAWRLNQELNGLLKWSADFDFQDVDTTTAAGTPTYPASAAPFHWAQCSATIGGSAVDVRKFDFAAELGQKIDRRYLRASALKKQPVRAAMPNYSGSLELDFDNTARYAEWLAGTTQSLVVTWTGAVIEGAHSFQVILTIAAAQWTGESPVVSQTDLPTQPLPFKALHNGTDPVVKLEYKSTDLTFG